MKINLGQKVFLAFAIFIVVGGLIWFLNYYKHDILRQKLQIIEEKDTLLNTILEARRYEKNYFMSYNVNDLKDAISYIQSAEKKWHYIIEQYGHDTLSKNLDDGLIKLRRYENSLKILFDFYDDSGKLKSDESVFKDYLRDLDETRLLGRTITNDVEDMVKEERKYVQKIIRESRWYHILALMGIVVLSVLSGLFLVFSVNRPLKAIEAAIHKIAVGDYTNIPKLKTGDEFESLVGSLNNMINELNRRNEQLIQTEKLASLGTLTSGVAHELNNPLNNISTSVQILLEELEDADIEYKRELLTETEQQIDRARDIVKALLEFSRERTFSLKQTRIKELVDNTITLIKGELPADVELVVDVGDDVQGAVAGRRIQQVLLNLILNAVQAMEDGGILTISARQETGNGKLCIQVQDTGRGIPEENIPKIFDPFFSIMNPSGNHRLRTSSSIIQQHGTGLGLSICHGIVEQHGGRIEVQSKLGEGTTFSIYLPARMENDATG